MKYLQQREKIIQSYYKSELNPYSGCACFIGNLLDNKDEWCYYRFFKEGSWRLSDESVLDEEFGNMKEFLQREVDSFYSPEDILKLESNFLKIIRKETIGIGNTIEGRSKNTVMIHPNYEEALFEAMDSTLDLLLEIHIKNNDISVLELEKPVFTKRNLELSH